MLTVSTRRPAIRLSAALCCAAMLAAACAPAQEDAMRPDMAEGMHDGMHDGMAMGDMAEVTVTAEAVMDTLPPEPLGWVGYRVEETDDAEARSWGPAFLYADDEAHSLDLDGSPVTLEPGEAVFVAAGVEHTPTQGGSWAFLLTDPDGDPPPGLDAAARELSSGPLEGFPDGAAQVRFLIVDLPPEGGQTTVHTHPGPEYISVADGRIEYETGLQATAELTVGDDAALPADTPVQKRNVSEEPARFWSWFVVDPGEPFSPEAAFDRS